MGELGRRSRDIGCRFGERSYPKAPSPRVPDPIDRRHRSRMVASDPNAPVLAYEHGIMNTGESFDEIASGTGRVTTPPIAHADYPRRRSARLYCELGGMVAALHEVHRRTTAFASGHLMRELAGLTEATR
jgi:hypothetical protein